MKNLKSKNYTHPTSRFSKYLILKQYGGLEYVTITHLPLIRIEETYPRPEFHTHSRISSAVAKAILNKNFCIRGIELEFFRKNVLKVSLEKFSKELHLSTTALFLWEQEKQKALHPINELAVRALLAEKLKMNLKLRLRKTDTPTKELRISAKKLVRFSEIKAQDHFHESGTIIE